MLTVPVMIDIDRNIQTMIQPDVLDKALVATRQALMLDLGVPVPVINVRMNGDSNKGEYIIRLNEVPHGSGRLRPQHVLARDTPEGLEMVDIPYVMEESFLPQMETVWVDAAHLEALRAAGVPYLESAQILSCHVGQIVRRRADEFIGIQETRARSRNL
ncbi:type III secretory pathway component EscV [Bradyrhizobium elkanii]|nr:type III secretory pathway component EscV [Bradyrhizobium elkanii]